MFKLKPNERLKKIGDLLFIKYYKATMITISILALIAVGILIYDLYHFFSEGLNNHDNKDTRI